MAVIVFFRMSMFVFQTLLSFVVLGVCGHIEYLIAGRADASLSFASFGLGVACLTILSLPLLLALDKLRRHVFTSTILFEMIWFFVLWILWAGVVGAASFGKAYRFPTGCIYDNLPVANRICHEITAVEAFAFLNFLCASTYDGTILLYAVVNSINGRTIWKTSVKESSNDTPGTVNRAVPMSRPRFSGAHTVQDRTYAIYFPSASTPQPHNTYPQEVSPVLQYDAYPQQVLQSPSIPPVQTQPSSYADSPGTRQQEADYASCSTSQTTDYATPPPQPNFGVYTIEDSHVPTPLPSRYQGQPLPE